MKKSIDFTDLFERVSDNREFAERMLNSFFDSWITRFESLEHFLNEEKYDELADGAHQMKGILGNLGIRNGFDLLKSIHEEARLKNPKKLVKHLNSLKKELSAAQDYFKESKHLFS